jgi:hypothetical protein
MEKLDTPAEVAAHIRRMPPEDREYIEAELLRDGYESGRMTEAPSVMDEIIRRANEARDSGDGLSREDSIARARRAALERMADTAD